MHLMVKGMVVGALRVCLLSLVYNMLRMKKVRIDQGQKTRLVQAGLA